MTVFQSASAVDYDVHSPFTVCCCAPTMYNRSFPAYPKLDKSLSHSAIAKRVWSASMSNEFDPVLAQNLIKLNRIASLQDNWNGYGAAPLPPDVIEHTKELLLLLKHDQPFISPTARDSIQLEYEKANGDYLEVEVFECQLTIYTDIAGNEYERIVPCNSTGYSVVKEGVEYFYGQHFPR